MDGEYDITMAFMAGLWGSGHCLGMCGGLVSAFFIRFLPQGQRVLFHAAYHGGRVGVYTLVGLLAGALGLALTSTGALGKVQGLLQIVAGLMVILLGLEILGLPWLRLSFDFWPMQRLRGLFARAGGMGTVRGPLLAGVINGLMPCSLTLAVAVKATAAGSVWAGGGLMLAFGLGTLPAMLFVSAAFSRMGVELRGYLLKVAALFVIVLGAGTLSQGVRYFLVMRQLANG